MKTAIEVDNLSKTFNLRADRRSSLKSAVIRVLKREKRDEEILLTVLKELSFTVNQGDVVGIVGENGTGKSTLLKIIAGILTPSVGKVKVSGKLAALLEIGLGFNPELTGRENALLYGTILGLTNQEISDRIGEIVEFAELTQFIDLPMRKYSSGMQMRLAFSVAMNVQPDVILLDEVFSVGDQRFQKKSYTRLQNMIRRDKAVMLVSHDLNVIRDLSTKVLFLKKGGGMTIGDPAPVLQEYMEYMSAER